MAKIIFLILLVIVAMSVAVRWQGKQYAAFMEKAQKAPGSIVHKEVRTFRPNQYTGKENWATYSYSVAGHTYQGEEKVEYDDIWHDLSEGQTVEIYYNPDQPQESHLARLLERRLKIAHRQ